MSSKILHEELERESRRLEQLRRDETTAYSAYCQARNKRDSQERECSYLFRKLVESISATPKENVG